MKALILTRTDRQKRRLYSINPLPSSSSSKKEGSQSGGPGWWDGRTDGWMRSDNAIKGRRCKRSLLLLSFVGEIDRLESHPYPLVLPHTAMLDDDAFHPKLSPALSILSRRVE
jgi:hypothetical protein